jgi:predicted site-specific integrase-resolvase
LGRRVIGRRASGNRPRILQVSERTLDDWAYRGGGPEFTHAGQQRRYRWEDVEKYLAERASGRSGAA